MTPKDKVIEKPLIGPDPKIKSNNAAISVVIFASRMVAIALSNPFFTARNVLESFLNSSLILSKTKTLASTAMPIVKTIPAIPGSVRVAPINPREEIIINKLAIKAIFAIRPNVP